VTRDDWLCFASPGCPSRAYIDSWERFRRISKVLRQRSREYIGGARVASEHGEGTRLQGRSGVRRCGKHCPVSATLPGADGLKPGNICDRASRPNAAEPQLQFRIAGPPIDKAIGTLMFGADDAGPPLSSWRYPEIRREIEARHEEANRTAPVVADRNGPSSRGRSRPRPFFMFGRPQ